MSGAPYSGVPMLGGVLDGHTVSESWGQDIRVPTIEPGGWDRYVLRRVGRHVVYVVER